MASLYDNTANVYKSEFRSIKLVGVEASGAFHLPSEAAKKVQVFNDTSYDIRVYKTSERVVSTSGTSSTDLSDGFSPGVFIICEDGEFYNIDGIGNVHDISVQKTNKDHGDLEIKYILSK